MPKSETPAAVEKRRVLIIDDHPIFRHGISAMINAEPDLNVCGEAGSAPAALDAMRRLRPDIALVDISMPGTNGIELLKSMRSESPKLPMLVVSMHDESLYALRALRAGALGYVMKAEALDSILVAIRKVLQGEPYLSPKFSDRLVFKAIRSMDEGLGSPVDKLSDRELEVLNLMGRGFGAQDIANELHLSVKTIETHRAHIKEKLDFGDSKEMVRFAIEWVAQQQA